MSDLVITFSPTVANIESLIAALFLFAMKTKDIAKIIIIFIVFIMD